MKRIFFLLAILISFLSHGQTPPGYTKINAKYDWIAGKFDSTITIPFGPTPSIRSGYDHSAALFYNTADSSLYVYTGTQWLKVGPGAGGGGGLSGTTDNKLVVSGSNLNTRKTFQTISIASGSPVINNNNGFNGILDLTQNAVATVSNAQDGDYATLVVVMGSGGPYTLSLPNAGSVSLKTGTGDTTTFTGLYRNSAWSWRSDYPFSLTGDVFASGAFPASSTIQNDAVTYAKMQNANPTVLLAGPASGVGNIREVKVAGSLSFSNDTLYAGTSSFDILDNTNHWLLEATGNPGEAQALTDLRHPATGIYDIIANDVNLRFTTPVGNIILNGSSAGDFFIWSPTLGTKIARYAETGEIYLGANAQSGADAGAYKLQTNGNVFMGVANQVRISNSIDADTYLVMENTDNSGGFFHYSTKDWIVGTNGTDHWKFHNTGGKFSINTLTADSILTADGSGHFTTNLRVEGRLRIGTAPISNDTSAVKILTIDNTGLVYQSNWNNGGGAGGVTSVSGTTNRITSTGGSTPVIDISATFENLLEHVANKATDFSTVNNTLYPTVQAVDNAISAALTSGLHYKASVLYATTAALAANTYNNGASGVGATLTGNANGAVSFDGVTPSVGNRVLVKNESAGANNGIYSVTTVGSGAAAYVLTRTTDFDQSAEVDAGSSMFVAAGNTLANTQWTQTATGTITIGTTAMSFVQIGASTAYTGTAPIDVTGSVISLLDDGVTFAKMQEIGANTWLGNPTGSTANPTATATGTLSKTDDTNVTLTLGGTPANSMLNAVSLTLGWTGQLSPGRGGSGTNNSGTFNWGANNITFTTGGVTSVSIPASGTLYGSQTNSVTSTDLRGTLTDETGTGAAVFATAPTITGGTHTAITGLGIRSTGSGAFDLSIANTENLTAGRTLTFTLNDANRTINLGGNFIVTGGGDLQFTMGGASTVTLPIGISTMMDLSSNQTATGKFITPRVTSIASSATPTPSAATDDIFTITALSQNATFGSPGAGVNGQRLVIRVLDNGTARTLGYNAIYRASTDLPFPTTTIISRTLYMVVMYNTASSTWDLVSVLNNF